MKIGIVTQYYPPNILGGSQISIFNIAKGLSMKGHSVEVFTSKSKDKTQNKKKFYLKNVTVYEIFKKEYSFGVVRTITKQKNMEKQLNEFLERKNKHFDVLYAYGMDTIPAVLKCKKHAKKIAASVNGSWATCPYYHIDYKGRESLNCSSLHYWYCTIQRIFRKNPVGSGTYKWIKIIFSPFIFFIYKKRLKMLKNMDIVMPISQKLKKILINMGINKEKLFVCHNLFEKVIPDKEFSIFNKYNISEENKIILFAGRLQKIKGCHTIIKAIPEIIAENKKVHLLFLGKGTEEKELRKIAEELGVENYVTFGGFLSIKQLAKAYKEAYVTVYPSIFFDPLPRTPTESFMQDTPVIGTNRGGCEELIKNGYNGLIISPDNSKELARSINRLLKDKKLSKKLSKNAIAFSKNFLIEKGIEDYINAFKK